MLVPPNLVFGWQCRDVSHGSPSPKAGWGFCPPCWGCRQQEQGGCREAAVVASTKHQCVPGCGVNTMENSTTLSSPWHRCHPSSQPRCQSTPVAQDEGPPIALDGASAINPLDPSDPSDHGSQMWLCCLCQPLPAAQSGMVLGTWTCRSSVSHCPMALVMQRPSSRAGAQSECCLGTQGR